MTCLTIQDLKVNEKDQVDWHRGKQTIIQNFDALIIIYS